MLKDLNLDFFLAPQESWGKSHGWYAVAKSGMHDARLLREEIINDNQDLANIKKAIVSQLHVDQEYNKEFMDFWETTNQTNPDRKIIIKDILKEYSHETYLLLLKEKEKNDQVILKSNNFDLFSNELENKPKQKERKRILKNN